MYRIIMRLPSNWVCTKCGGSDPYGTAAAWVNKHACYRQPVPLTYPNRSPNTASPATLPTLRSTPTTIFRSPWTVTRLAVTSPVPSGPELTRQVMAESRTPRG